MAFKKGHPHYTTKGDFKKGNVPWNARTSVWLEFTCLNCGKIHRIRKCHATRDRGKYCNKECFTESQKGQIRLNRRQRLIRVCQQCDEFFEIRPCESYRKFCSPKCGNNSRIGKRRPPFTEDHKRKIGEANKGNSRWGEQSNHWKGGITPLCEELRTLEEYKQWRMACLRRDWFKCQDCDSKEKLRVHHKKPFAELVTEFLKEYDQFSPIEDRETLVRLAMKYKLFWDIDNGKTLCAKCHNLIKEKTCQLN